MADIGIDGDVFGGGVVTISLAPRPTEEWEAEFARNVEHSMDEVGRLPPSVRLEFMGSELRIFGAGSSSTDREAVRVEIHRLLGITNTAVNSQATQRVLVQALSGEDDRRLDVVRGKGLELVSKRAHGGGLQREYRVRAATPALAELGLREALEDMGIACVVTAEREWWGIADFMSWSAVDRRRLVKHASGALAAEGVYVERHDPVEGPLTIRIAAAGREEAYRRLFDIAGIQPGDFTTNNLEPIN